MTTHLGVMILFAACVSVVFAVVHRETAADEVRFALRLFAGLAAGAYVLGWVMYLAFG